jgi:large subunit ribosomal protein L6
MRIKELKEKLQIPEKAQLTITGGVVTAKGPKGEVQRKFNLAGIDVKTEGNMLWFTIKNANKKDKTKLGTTRSHINNMLNGVVNSHTYRLKICSGHFPMTAAVSGSNFVIKNFLGEKVPRIMELKKGATVKMEGSEIVVESPDIELAGQVAADIEQLTRITKRDGRIFQDGIYIIKKSKKESI